MSEADLSSTESLEDDQQVGWQNPSDDGKEVSEKTKEEQEHQNPITAEDATDDERAEMLQEYLDAISDICPEPRLMPLDKEGKMPAITDEYRLDTEQSQSLLHTPDEAIEAIRNGKRGFALYAGKESHGTEDLVLVDHDDMDTFPLDTLPDTLTVMSGSGRGYHETFENAGDVRNAQGKDEMSGAGEIRASNWYCILPGSIHPSEGVYHVTHNRSVVELEAEDIPEGLQPSTSSFDEDIEVEIRRDEDRDDSEYVNSRGLSLNEVREYDWKLDSLLSEDFPAWTGVTDDNSKIEAKLVRRLRYHHFEHSQIANIWQQYRWRDDLKRDDLIRITIRNCGSHDDRARYNRDPVDIDATLPSAPSFDERDAVAEDESELTLEGVRNRCQNRIKHGIQHGDRTLIDALPTTGKSRGLVAAVAETGVSATVFTARHDLYEQYVDWCEEEGLDYYTLPSFHNDCPTARGDFDDDEDERQGWKSRVMSLYQEGARPKEIHKQAVEQFGEPLPCEEGNGCPYKSKWDFEPEDYDLLIGHYTHAYNDTVTADRVVAFDESPTSSFVVERSGENVSQIVSTYLDLHDPREGTGQLTGLPFEDYTDLIERRSDDDLRQQAIDWFESAGIERDVTTVFKSNDNISHALAPILTYALLVAEDLGNGWETAPIDSSDGGRVAARSRESGKIVLLRPPALEESEAVIGLDGTPTPRLWRLTVDPTLDHRQVLTDDERASYLSGVLDLRVVQTTEAVKPYSSGEYVTTDKDRVLFDWVSSTEDRRPALISTQKALNTYDAEGITASIGKTKHYGDLKGSNEFAQKRVGIVAGSQHYGDEFVKRWGALAGEAVERGEGKGSNLDYGESGNDILQHMREHETLQAVMRFGRDGKGANVYVHTATLPDWVSINDSLRVKLWSEGMREIINVLQNKEQEYWTTSDVDNDLGVSITQRQIRNNMDKLADAGYLDKHQTDAGSANKYEATSLPEINPEGVVLSDSNSE